MSDEKTDAARASRGLVVVAVALAFATGGGACGSDSDAGATGAPAERQIRATIDRMGEALAGSDARALCGLMSRQALHQLPEGASPDVQGCVRTFRGAFLEGGVHEDPHPRVIGINVDGDQATARARPRPGAEVQRAAFIKEGGEWKVLGWFTD